jgi:transposase
MSITAAQPATTPIPVQLSETEFATFILPCLSMPKRGPKCKLGYHRVFNLILWVLYTGMQWKCLPIPHDAQGKPAIHYTTIYKVLARWADDGSLWQAFIASVRHLATAKHLDVSVLRWRQSMLYLPEQVRNDRRTEAIAEKEFTLRSGGVLSNGTLCTSSSSNHRSRIFTRRMCGSSRLVYAT